MLDGVTPEHTKRTAAKFKKWDDYISEGGTSEYMLELLSDPSIYIYAFFRDPYGNPLKVYSYQDILLNVHHPRTLIPASNQVGKSFYLCLKHIMFGLRNPGTTSLILSRSMFQAKDLMTQIRSLLKLSVLDFKTTIGETENKTELTFRHISEDGKELKDSRIICAPASETALGFAVSLLSGDEFGFWDTDTKHMYYQVLQPRTYHTKGSIQIISNPNGTENFMYELWLSEEFYKYRVTFLDCPGNTKEEFDKLCATMPQAQIDSTLLGKFTMGSGAYFTTEEINQMLVKRSNLLPPKALMKKPFYVFLDLAKVNDRTVRYIGVPTETSGVYVYETFEYKEKTPYNEIVEDLKQLILTYGRDLVAAIGFDASGVGSAVEDWIRPLSNFGVRVSPIKFTLQSKSQMYTLLKLLAERNVQEQGTLSGINIPYSDEAKFQFTKLVFKKSNSGNLMIHHENENDRDDFCFVKGTKILTNKGEINIEDLNIGDYVLTRVGYKRIVSKFARFSEVITRCGITGTPDHPFITSKGIVKFKNLKASHIIYTWNEKQSTIKATNFIDIQIQRGNIYEIISGHTQKGINRLSHYIGSFGKFIMVKLKTSIQYIIKTGTVLIIKLKISNVYLKQNTNHIMPKKDYKSQKITTETINCCKKIEKKPKYGTSLKKVKNGILNIIRKVSQKHILKDLRKNVYSAKKSICLLLRNLWHAQLNVMRKISGKRKNLQKVYNFEVEDSHEYFANGILVHNCDGAAGLAYLILDPEHIPSSVTIVPNNDLIVINKPTLALKPSSSEQCECGNWLEITDTQCSYCGKEL
jgi:hypothetical protein